MRRRLIILGLAGIAAAIAVAASSRGGPDISGYAVVTDGDTIRVGDHKVRIFGIDAPESRQSCQDAEERQYPCGQRATEHLKKVTTDRRVECVRVASDRYGRTVATCSVYGQVLSWSRFDIGQEMVSAGWARDDATYSKGRYAAAEKIAKQEKLGIWAGTSETPKHWRDEHRGRR